VLVIGDTGEREPQLQSYEPGCKTERGWAGIRVVRELDYDVRVMIKPPVLKCCIHELQSHLSSYG
jgi:hypothetical protein